MAKGIGDYEFRGLIGSGTTGTVFLGHHVELDRPVAIKELAPELSDDPGFVDRFREEAATMAQLDNPHCVRVYDFIEDEDRAFLVAEYVDGASLRKVVETSGRLTPEQSLGVLKGALLGLGRAHDMDLVHRDVKPENILVDRNGVSKLADFGQAVSLHGGIKGAAGMATGTPSYMSPEQVRGKSLDQRTDIYSAGAVLCELLTGRPPFMGDNARAIMRAHAFDAAPDPRDFQPGLPLTVSAMVQKALAKTPDARQQTAAEFLAELEAAAAAAYGKNWEKRSSMKKAVLAAVPLAAVGGGGLGLLIGAGGLALVVAAGAAFGISHYGGSSQQATAVVASTTTSSATSGVDSKVGAPDAPTGDVRGAATGTQPGGSTGAKPVPAGNIVHNISGRNGSGGGTAGSGGSQGPGGSGSG
ncbi:MAG: eukaryotic-like serine/threonine-protein kinase, partial [Chloroflexota bacterium]|nr:eukaryotic-like serine/threonine-protein kinase [Chloroflexota bacterium]